MATLSKTSRTLLAASLGLAMLAGCTTSPLGSITPSTGVKSATRSTAATTLTAATTSAKLTSTSQVSSVPDAQALAVNDEGLVETTSAAMEADEADSSYAIAALDESADDPADASAAAGPQGDRRYGGPFGGQMGPMPNQRQGQMDAPMNDQMGGQFVGQFGRQGHQMPQQRNQQANQRPEGRGEMHGRFEDGAFGGGCFEEADMPAPPRLARHAAEPAPTPRVDESKLAKRRVQAQNQAKRFLEKHPQYSADEAMIRQVLNAQPWQKSSDDPTTVYKSGSASLTLGTGVSRKVAVLRVIQAAKPHALVKAQTDIADVYADKASKTVHWEKTLQADGSFSLAYHHEYTDAKGKKYVADWSKTLTADGHVTGSGTFTTTDASGALIAQQTLTIGGDDTTGSTVTTGDAAATPAPAPTATPSPEATAATEVGAVAEDIASNDLLDFQSFVGN
jgi:hypothetical protein